MSTCCVPCLRDEPFEGDLTMFYCVAHGSEPLLYHSEDPTEAFKIDLRLTILSSSFACF